MKQVSRRDTDGKLPLGDAPPSFLRKSGACVHIGFVERKSYPCCLQRPPFNTSDSI